ncbi:RNA polymerase sigma factor SigK [Catellatospora sp. IY07-71]|uniref:ECF RNA polymerase sigma factor SigK n=1 Tax=Catellatospora sp. IY07-71 TaxID=2728827 RepID=UPI001BB5BA02|nr:ECF RNA polymerase sigma factor SigK [Catellatospora sp. IY07-71]BCJ73524.1 RNA polymerase sigma factor SigK [Catellatospora sp. IY07-71]
MNGDEQPYQRPDHLTAVPGAPAPADAESLLRAVARGDEAAFTRLYDLVAPRVYGLARRVLRDPAQAEEVAQEALLEVWRTASRFDSARGSATAWIFTITHRRAVDRVRSEQAALDRVQRLAPEASQTPADEVVEQATAHLQRQAVRRCLRTLTELQREAITLAYYGGYTYQQVAQLLGAGLPTVKTRMRDGLIRLRDCLGVEVAA